MAWRAAKVSRKDLHTGQDVGRLNTSVVAAELGGDLPRSYQVQGAFGLVHVHILIFILVVHQ